MSGARTRDQANWLALLGNQAHRIKREPWVFNRLESHIDFNDARAVFRVAHRYEAEEAARVAVAAVNCAPMLLEDNEALRELVAELADELASHLMAFGFSAGAAAKLDALLARARAVIGP